MPSEEVLLLPSRAPAPHTPLSMQVLRLTLEETEARLPSSEERPRSSGVQTAAQLAFVPLAAAAYALVRQASCCACGGARPPLGGPACAQ